MLFQSPRGMHDILPLDQLWWEKLEKTAKDTAAFYNFRRIEPSIVESEELFKRALGETSDVVEKQLYVLKSEGGLVLRPEFTASMVRAYLQHGLQHLGQPLKLYAMGPVFRHESPQAGRYRELHQLDFEIFSSESDPIYDAQIILALQRFVKNLKVKNVTTYVNTIGCRSCRPGYRRKLLEYYGRHEKELCADCRRRISRNPFRLLDCKDENCVKLKIDAPNILDNLCAACSRHFKAVLEFIEEVKIPYIVTPHLVRGLDYYNRTVFEMFAEGFDFAIAGGGRFDDLAGMLGGKATSATGGAIGLERVLEVMKTGDLKPSMGRAKSKIFLVYVGDLAKKKTLALMEEFGETGVLVAESLGKESLKAQLRAADKSGAALALILGQKEVFEETIILRDLKSGNQETVPLTKIIAEVKKRLK
ncbi:histidine--tRNA ligase [Candidatus Wolfebacteria bacterium RIFCSPLOWO2_01_FULL_45_19]|uniref:Histidine--tRNA ligase n=1 Tax=Candidatus Wolfebacteria bacterium RIFCSPLOWO2_01_FULL_45_19 TaxID=1802557 RepID=A0A1F8DPU4_9BACT|nr:MAG: histidine--tRNA ligase [Candidatus Wolfebacteria bacterium RIFCSPLOWO2_01_FULL_45_19]